MLQKLSKKQLQAVQTIVQVVIQTTQTICRLKPELPSTKRAIRTQEHPQQETAYLSLS